MKKQPAAMKKQPAAMKKQPAAMKKRAAEPERAVAAPMEKAGKSGEATSDGSLPPTLVGEDDTILLRRESLCRILHWYTSLGNLNQGFRK